jgi:hypothetical protein
LLLEYIIQPVNFEYLALRSLGLNPWMDDPPAPYEFRRNFSWSRMGYYNFEEK